MGTEQTMMLFQTTMGEDGDDRRLDRTRAWIDKNEEEAARSSLALGKLGDQGCR